MHTLKIAVEQQGCRLRLLRHRRRRPRRRAPAQHRDHAPTRPRQPAAELLPVLRLREPLRLQAGRAPRRHGDQPLRPAGGLDDGHEDAARLTFRPHARPGPAVGPGPVAGCTSSPQKPHTNHPLSHVPVTLGCGDSPAGCAPPALRTPRKTSWTTAAPVDAISTAPCPAPDAGVPPRSWRRLRRPGRPRRHAPAARTAARWHPSAGRDAPRAGTSAGGRAGGGPAPGCWR